MYFTKITIYHEINIHIYIFISKYYLILNIISSLNKKRILKKFFNNVYSENFLEKNMNIYNNKLELF